MSTELNSANTDSHRYVEQGTPPSTPASGFGVAYSDTDGALHYINDAGTNFDLTAGVLATATELTIATGVITVTGNYHSVDTEADASTDDVDTISGGAEGDTVIFFAASDARDIVFKNGTDNIVTFGGDDITLDEDHKLVKFVRGATNWRELGNMSGITASSTNTLTNKSIDGDNNPITNVGFTAFDTDVSDTMSFSSGAYLDSPAVTVTSDGATISVNFEKSGGGDVRVIFNAGVTVVDCTPILSATLTAGSDASPQKNYVYLLQSAPTVLTISTSSFPATSVDHAPVAIVFVQSAASLQTDGAYKVHAWTDHMGNGGLGHLSHLNAWIRNQAATWISGAAITPTITVNGGSEDNVDVATTAGVVRQLHEHAYPVFDTAVSSDVYVVNHNTAAYTIINDLNAADQDDAGNAIGNNDWTNLVLWGVANEVSADCKLFLNLPSGFHSTALGATIDAEGKSNYTMPSEYTGVGFLIARLTLKFSTGSSGTWTLEENLDLRASGAVGGGSGTGGTEFQDNVFKILNVTDPTKEVAFDASGVPTSTTATVTMTTDVTLLKDNLAGTIAPTTTDDSASGYSVGSHWIDTVANLGYICVDATASAAVWTEVTAGAGGGETNTASNVGTGGVGVFKQKTGVDLEFKKINAGSSKVTITDDTGDSEVDIDVVEANLTLDNLGGTLALTKGGTGSTTASGARTNLGVAIGSDVQAWDAQLDDIAALTIANGATIQSNATNWVAVTNNMVATVAPAVTDDNTAGYAIGSIWFDLTADRVYDLLDAATGAAVWVLRSSPFGSTSVKGIVEYATTSEVEAGTDAGRVVRPVSLPTLHQDNKYTYAIATGAVNTFALALTPTVSALAAGQIFQFKANLANTGAATLNVDTLGAKSILKNHDVALVSGDIEINQFVTVIYNGTAFEMLSQLGNAASGGGATVTSDSYTLNEGSDYTTTSGTFVDVDATNLSLTITTTGNPVRVVFSGGNVGSGTITFFDIDVDGARHAGDDGIVNSNADVGVHIDVLISGLSAASHTFKLQWKRSAGTATLYAGAGTSNKDLHAQFSVVEIS